MNVLELHKTTFCRTLICITLFLELPTFGTSYRPLASPRYLLSIHFTCFELWMDLWFGLRLGHLGILACVLGECVSLTCYRGSEPLWLLVNACLGEMHLASRPSSVSDGGSWWVLALAIKDQSTV